jgi:hypothetical protein
LKSGAAGPSTKGTEWCSGCIEYFITITCACWLMVPHFQIAVKPPAKRNMKKTSGWYFTGKGDVLQGLYHLEVRWQWIPNCQTQHCWSIRSKECSYTDSIAS